MSDERKPWEGQWRAVVVNDTHGFHVIDERDPSGTVFASCEDIECASFISAAADLYRALECVLSQLDPHSLGSITDAARRDAEAALRKARGET